MCFTPRHPYQTLLIKSRCLLLLLCPCSSWFETGVAAMEAYIRPGCLHLTVQAVMDPAAAAGGCPAAGGGGGVALRPDTGCNASGSGRHGMAAEEPAAPPCCEAAPGPQAAAAAGGGSGSGSRPDGGAGGVGSSSSRKRAAEEAAPGDVHVRRVVARMLCSGE